MRGEAMKKVLQELNTRGVDLKEMQALEIFAREGNWQTQVYANEVKSLEAWEIDPAFESGLRKNLSGAKIKITDSIKELENKDNFECFDFIVVDNPQNCYGQNSEYCEHFDVIPKILKLLKKSGILIFNINRQPFNYQKFTSWVERRNEFYELKDAHELKVGWLLDFYKDLFLRNGKKTDFCFSMSRQDLERNDYLHYLVYHLTDK